MTELKNAFIRAARTYVQGVLGLVLAAGLTDFDLSTAKAVAVAALPAAIAVLQNYLEQTTPVEVPRA